MKAIRLTQLKNEQSMAYAIKEKPSSTRIVGWFNSKFKRISSETLTRAVIALQGQEGWKYGDVQIFP
jgi:hypothetical protein